MGTAHLETLLADNIRISPVLFFFPPGWYSALPWLLVITAGNKERNWMLALIREMKENVMTWSRGRFSAVSPAHAGCVQDGRDKGACADSCKLVCCEGKIEVNTLQKHFCYFFGWQEKYLMGLLCHSALKKPGWFTTILSLFPTPPYPTTKISLCAKIQPDVIKP